MKSTAAVGRQSFSTQDSQSQPHMHLLHPSRCWAGHATRQESAHLPVVEGVHKAVVLLVYRVEVVQQPRERLGLKGTQIAGGCC